MENLHRDQDAYPAGDYFLFLKTTLESDSSRNSITVAAAVKRSRFEEHFIRENGTRMYIEDPGRNLEYFAPGATGNSESCRRLASPSRVLNWRYVCLLPDSAQKETARKIQLITLAGLAISSLLCLPLSFVLSKKNYEPVRKLISYFRSSEKNDDPRENEFLWLQERTGEFLKENRETRKAIQKYYAQSWYSRETEQKLLNLVRAGDGGEAAALVRRTFESINFPEELSGTMKRLLAYDLLGILVRGIHQDGEELLDEFGIEEISPADLPAFMEKTVLSACEDRQRILQNKNNRVLCEKAKNYINENYHNPSLNISQTGYSLGISPFYLSSIFREETGQSLLEYINTRRIDEGKRLLEEGRGLAEIAEMTGFRGSGAFIRVFKKLAGITPGQYKKTS
jgi:AraC-like DNA-binding protein